MNSEVMQFLMSRFSRLAPLILIILTPVILLWRLVFAGEVLYWGLPLYQFYPWHSLVVEAIRAGHLPLWTDLLGNGTPLLANHQSAVFYPFNLIYFVMPVERAMGYSVVLHLILAGLTAYAWGRTIGLSRLGGTVTGLSFMLGGFFVARTQFITIINAAAWLPLLFLLAERLTRRRALLDAVGLSIVLALQFLAGHAQLWFYSLWVVGAYVLVRAWSVRRERPGDGGMRLAWGWTQRGRVFALLAGALILSLSLAAIQLLPTAELSLYSQRADGLDPDEAMTYSLWPWRLLTLAVPTLFGSPATGDYWGYATYWEDAGYIGVLPLLMAFSAAWAWGRRQLSALVRLVLSLVGRWARKAEPPKPEVQKADKGLDDCLISFSLLLVLLSLILAMGRNTFIYPLVFKYVPGFDAFRAPARFLLFYTFGISALAGIGANCFRLTYRTQYVARLTAAGAGAMLVVSLAVGQSDLAIKPTFAPALTHFAVWLGLSAILTLLCPAQAGLGPAQAGLGHAQAGLCGREPTNLDPRVARSPLPLGVWRGLVAIFIAVDLALFAAPLTPTIDPALYRIMTDADRFLLVNTDDDRIFTTYDYDYDTKFSSYLAFSGWGSSDLGHWQSFRETLVPNLNVFSRTPSVNNDDPLVVGRWRGLMDALRVADWPDRLRLLRMMNVGYVLAKNPPPDLSPVHNVSHLYRLSEPLPRAWVVAYARVMPAPDDLLSELMADTFDPSSEVLIESTYYSLDQSGVLGLETRARTSPNSPSAPGSHPQLAPVTISLREDGNSRTIDLVMSQPGYLVLAYTYYPGWRATVNGHPAQILRANYAFMALPLEPGEHQVVLRYQPVSLLMGGFISGLSLLAVIGTAALHAIRKSAD